MKKIILLLIGGLLLTSCVDKKKEGVETSEESKVVTYNYSVVFDAIYKKEDSIKVYYKLNGYFNYDNPVVAKINGSDSIQKIKIDMPAEIAVENFSIVASTNKDQNTLVIRNISVERNNKIIFDGSAYKYNDYFLSDESFSWDDKNQRFNLNHSNKYPPGIIGNDKLEGLMFN